MPLTAFSFTAPVITEEQEKKELEALSNAEREEIDRDVTGKHVDDYVETPAMIQRGLLEFMEALEQIPEENKVDYLMARDVCPELVQRESSPLAFLRRDMFDPWVSASRLIAVPHSYFPPQHYST